MTSFVRRMVSGPKARHVDKELNVDLDLSYITDRLIIMGWPAAKLESLYRNRRKDVRRFLDAKHGEKYRVYNLCPCSENSYDAKEFYGAVSRFPFPDHHPPPLSLIPMFVCDITAWLAEDPENVAVIHCKAGKGRSGTMACCYLLSLPILPKAFGEKGRSRSVSPSSSSPKGRLLESAVLTSDDEIEEVMATPGAEATSMQHQDSVDGKVDLSQAYTVEALAERLQAIFEMHTARRLKPEKRRDTAAVANKKADPTSADLAFLKHDPTPSPQDTRPSSRVGVAHTDVDAAGLATESDNIQHRRKGSVSTLIRKASRGFLRRGSSPAPGKQDSRPDLASSLVMSTNSTPPRQTALLSSPYEQANKSTSVLTGQRRGSEGVIGSTVFGVSPKGRSMVDLSQSLNVENLGAANGSSQHSNDQQKPSCVSSPFLPAPAVVQGFGSSASDLFAGRTDFSTSSSTTPFGARSEYFSSRAASPVAPARLAPPLFRAGETVPALLLHRKANDTLSQYTFTTPDASMSRLSLHRHRPSIGGMSDGFDDPIGLLDDDEDEGEHANAPTSQRFAVSIPSQRRFVGYWARVLADLDPRLPFSLYGSMKPRRTVCIKRILIDRQTVGDRKEQRQGAEDGGKGVALSVQLARYDPALEHRLHQWEVNARRRTRAFGVTDPSACAPTLPPDELEEHGTDFKGPERRELEREADRRRWEQVVQANDVVSYERKMSQHDNEAGVGRWGINVLAEQERVRHFKWNDADHDEGVTEKSDLRDKRKKEMQIETFATLQESSRLPYARKSHAETYADEQSTAATSDNTFDKNSRRIDNKVVRHTFDISSSETRNVIHGAPVVPTWIKSAFQSTHSTDDEKEASEVAAEVRTSGDGNPSSSMPDQSSATTSASAAHQAHSSSDTSPSGSSMWAKGESEQGKLRREGLSSGSSGSNGSANDRLSTPLTSVESLRATPSSQKPAVQSQSKAPAADGQDISSEHDLNVDAQVVVDADCALQIKILAGRSGATHSRLPDIASCGYIWFIPAFEHPTSSTKGQKEPGAQQKLVPRRGDRVRCTFLAHEIDFRKQKQIAKVLGGEIRRVVVEFEWMETGPVDEIDDD